MKNEHATQEPTTDAEAGGQVRAGVMCQCINWARIGPEFGGDHHHVRCEKYSTKKYPRLFYWEEGCNSWVSAPVLTENIISVESHFSEHGESVDIRFKRVDMTDKEYAELPEE